MYDLYWRLAIFLLAVCVATLHILRLRRESQDRQLWLQDMAERRTERAERQQERAERRQGRRTYSAEEYMEEAAYY